MTDWINIRLPPAMRIPSIYRHGRRSPDIDEFLLQQDEPWIYPPCHLVIVWLHFRAVKLNSFCMTSCHSGEVEVGFFVGDGLGGYGTRQQWWWVEREGIISGRWWGLLSLVGRWRYGLEGIDDGVWGWGSYLNWYYSRRGMKD